MPLDRRRASTLLVVVEAIDLTDNPGGASMTGWGRCAIAAIGLAILIAVLFAMLALEALASLCPISDSATCASGPPSVVLLLMPLTVVGGYVVTVWRVQLTPVLLSTIAAVSEAILIGLFWN